jgi:hypothetical protein
MAETTIDITDLLPGDVLLFSYEPDDVISTAIHLVTASPVSHAALCYSTRPESMIAEETPPNAARNPADERFAGRTVYVRRFAKPADLSRVTAAAAGYCDEQEPYPPMGELVLLGLVLLFERNAPDTRLGALISEILEHACQVVSDWINRQKYPKHSMPMVCSQFVAQCYQDCGPSYQLHFDSCSGVDTDIG